MGTKNLSGKQKRESFLPFLEARAKVREKGFSSLSEFRKWVSQEKPLGIPYSPEKFYRDSGWVDTYDWRGVPRSHSLEFVSFSEAREFARSLGFKSTKKWQDWSKTKEKPFGKAGIKIRKTFSFLSRFRDPPAQPRNSIRYFFGIKNQ